MIVEPGSLDLVQDVETNRWSCTLKMSHLGTAGNIAYMIRANLPNVLKFKVVLIKLQAHFDKSVFLGMATREYVSKVFKHSKYSFFRDQHVVYSKMAKILK